jgi:hypothetical protein
MKNILKSIRDYFNSYSWRMGMIYTIYSFFSIDIPICFYNLWFFRKEIFNFRPYDYRYSLKLFGKSIERMANYIEINGSEVKESRLKKVEKMRRVVELINIINSDDYLGLAEDELGLEYVAKIKWVPIENGNYQMESKCSEKEEEDNSKISERSREMEELFWNELWDILKGTQKYEQFESRKDWRDKLNGTNMRGWWD